MAAVWRSDSVALFKRGLVRHNRRGSEALHHVLLTVELVTSAQHKVSLKKVIDWLAHAGGKSPREIAMKARVREG